MKKIPALAILAVFLLSLVPISIADEGSGSSGTVDSNTEVKADPVQIKIREGVRADLREDVHDLNEDDRDKKEDIRDVSNVDRERCIQKCKNLTTGVDCEAKCKMMDMKENVHDKREDIRDKTEDFREKNRERLMKIAALDKRQIDKLSDLTEDEIKKLSEISRERLKDLSEEDMIKLKAKLSAVSLLRVKDADELSRKKITDERLEELRLKYEAAKKEFEEHKQELSELKDELKEAKKENNESDVIAKAKEYLTRTADAMISHLEKLKVRVQESENIEAETEAKIVAEIDAHILEINAIKTEINAATTKEQVKEAAKKLRAKWNELAAKIKIHAGRVILARVEGIVNHGEVLEKRLEHILAKAEEKGIEVDVSAEIELFKEDIDNAKDKYSQAQAKLAEAIALKGNESRDDIKKLVEEANALLKESRDYVKAANDVLKDIIKKIREAYPEADLSEEVEVEVVQDSSVEVEAESNTEASASS